MDGKQLTALMKKRDDLITFLNANLEKQIQESQQGLLKKFLAGFGDLLQTDETGRVLNNAFNRNLLLSVDKVFADYGKQHNVLILAALMQGVNQLMNFNADYYGKFEGETKLLPIRKKVVQNMRGWLGINENDTAQENGYLSTLIKSDAVKNQIKDFALKSVMGQAGWQDTKKNLEKLIAGDKDNLGALQKYHRNFSYDLLSQVDRATGKTYADDLKFEFAIYEGGLIETSREFCKKHNGNVYHISEIQKFNPQVAKQPNYNPVTDLGGYGCRHHLNWIPTAMAKAMGKDVDKFLKGGQNKGNTQVVEEKQKQKQIDKKNINDVFSAEKITYSKKLSKDEMALREKQIVELANEYKSLNSDYKIEQITFNSAKNTHGKVVYDAESKIISINFGDNTPDAEMYKNSGSYDQYKTRQNPFIDEDKIKFYTQTHEFAHTLFNYDERRYKSTNNNFKTELEAIQKEYSQEIQKYMDEIYKFGSNPKMNERRIINENKTKINEIHLGSYASKNINEFLAEAFADYKLNKTPSKYAIKVGVLIDKYFKK